VNKDIFNVNPSAKLVAWIQGENLGPKELVAFGARGTIKRGDPYTLYREALESGDINNTINRILNVTIGSGHIDVLDQATYTFVFSDIPRLATLFLVSPPYLSHLQQSMRYVEPYGVYLPPELNEENEIRQAMEEGIKLYYKLVELGAPKEDARFILPLYTVTNIQTTGNVREYTHLYLMARDQGVPPICRELVNMAIDQIDKELTMDREANYNRMRYFPAPNLFNLEDHLSSLIERYGESNVTLLSYNHPIDIDENMLKKAIKYGDESYLGVLKHISYTFLLRMSIVTYHQAVRQRTWQHHVESIYKALNRLDYITPPSIIKLGLHGKFREYVEKLYKLYHTWRETYPTNILIGIVSHAHTVYDLVKIDGWNYIGALPLRRCLRAQWEIRQLMSEVSRLISRVNPKLGKYSLPTCRTLGVCYEKRPCEHVDKLLAMEPIIK